MSDDSRERPQPDTPRSSLFVLMPRRVNFSGDEIVALRDRRGLVTVLLAAELVLTTWGGRPRMPGHIINFKDGNHHNLEVDNLEWVPDHADAPDGVP